jgi:tellurite resistance protein
MTVARLDASRIGGSLTMSDFLSGLRGLYRSQLERYRQRPFLRAVMAACALVSVASGGVSFRQRIRLDLLMETLDDLKVFDPHEGVGLFNGFVEELQKDAESGRRLARQAVAAEVSGHPEKARLLMRICLAISERDGTIPPPEQHEIDALCRWIGIEPDKGCSLEA